MTLGASACPADCSAGASWSTLISCLPATTSCGLLFLFRPPWALFVVPFEVFSTKGAEGAGSYMSSQSSWFYFPLIWGSYKQGCESTDKSMNRDRESRPRLGSGASFFWVSLSNLVIDDNFRISNNLAPVLAANISAALAIQPVRDREIEIILWFF